MPREKDARRGPATVIHWLRRDSEMVRARRRLSGHWIVIVGISDNNLTIHNPAAGMQTWEYDCFMSKYLLQTAERPLIYAP